MTTICRHLHRTLTRGTFPHGTPVAVYQCDACGMAMPKDEPPADVDIWSLPAFDEQAAERGYGKAIATVFGVQPDKTQQATVYAKRVNPNARRYVRRSS